jgi:hypothetical protein
MVCHFCEKNVKNDIYEKHLQDCYKLAQESGALVEMPEDGAVMDFKKWQNSFMLPYFATADFEACVVPELRHGKKIDIETIKKELLSNDKNNDDELSNTVNIARHEANSVGFHFVDTHDSSKNYYKQFSGEGFITQWFVYMFKTAYACVKEMRKNEPMAMTARDERTFKASTHCSICNKEFTKDCVRVRDHDHATGKFRGAAHELCNLNYYPKRFFPVLIHNLKNYDVHFLIRAAHEISQALNFRCNFSCIPINGEKFMCLSVGCLKLVDSFQFMATSLENLTQNLIDNESEDKYRFFVNMRREFPEHMELLCKKGHYPYAWVDSPEKMKFRGLPPREAFDNDLTGEKLTDDQWNHVQEIYRVFKIEYFEEYHNIYLKCDCVLLADIFQRFREVSHADYGLDPLNYVSVPGLAWEAMLKMTGIQLELITDPEILNMLERQKRGGLCFVGSKRHATANNPELENYDPTQPTSFIQYYDVNNLYGKSMTEPLPYQDFVLQKITDESEEDLINQISGIGETASRGCIIELDMFAPVEIHDKLKEFPPAPENIEPKLEWFSDFQKELGIQTGVIKENETYKACCKLIPHLFARKNYVLHYRNLQFLLKLGFKITKIHKILWFDQKPWLKAYIDFNTRKRAQAGTTFEKDFYKLMNNSVFGKTIENVRNRVDIRIATNDPQAIKQFTKPTYKHSKYIDGIYLIEHYKKKIVYDKPLYVGTSILDLSKLCMMDFHYNVIQKDFPGRYHLLYSDTDSFVYQFYDDDIYKYVGKNHHLFDLSEYERPGMRNDENKKVLGKMKDETHGLQIIEFTSLNPKVYSFKCQKKDKANKIIIDNKKCCKGVSKTVVKKEITHDDYVNQLNNPKPLVKCVVSIRSQDHHMKTIVSAKKALTSMYDKSQQINHIDNVPFGYGVKEYIEI